jgi:uncharacterized protein with HXXEE motif
VDVDAALFWALPIAAAAHVFEEFVFPGGFKRWYARYRPETAVSFTPAFAVGINALMLVGCSLPLLQGPVPQSIALWLTLAALLAGNAVFHARATLKMREYSPGLATALLLYLPLAAIGFAHFLRTGEASMGTAVAAALLGGSYSFWSAMNHRRRARRRGGPAPEP